MTTNSVKKQRDKYRAAGLVQINAWVPAKFKALVLRDCARLRVSHLRQKP